MKKICKSFGSKYLSVVMGCLSVAACSGSTGADHGASPEEQRAEIEAMYEDYRNEFSDIKEIHPSELADAYRSNELVIVDVRTPEEQAISMIPGAITKEAFEESISDQRDARVVVHCTIGYRSGVYVKELAERGIEAENMAGSLLLWAHEGLPLEDAEGRPTSRVHVYGKKWNLLPAGYEGVW